MRVLSSRITMGVCFGKSKEHQYAQRSESLVMLLSHVRHLINTGSVSHVYIYPMGNLSVLKYHVVMYNTETLIFTKNKRLSYVNFPLHIVLSYCKASREDQGLSIHIHYTAGYTGCIVKKETYAGNILIERSKG